MLIEYEVKYRGSCVKISQRIGSCSASNLPSTVPDGTIWRSLGASYFEAPGGSGLDTGYPGGSGLPPSGPGGSGFEDSAPGGSGYDDSAPGGSGFDDSAPGGSGYDDSAPGGAAAGPKPIVIFGPIVTWE